VGKGQKGGCTGKITIYLRVLKKKLGQRGLTGRGKRGNVLTYQNEETGRTQGKGGKNKNWVWKERAKPIEEFERRSI